tara:strand:+ start:16360 stop:18519 length:2160 start_codon:yes stop_codon:yes gene_type:complete
MNKIKFVPASAGYTYQPGNPNIETKLDGGISLTRQDILNPSSIVSCQWVLENDVEYEEFNIFFKGPAKEGAAWFLMDLTIDEAYPVERTCKFVSGSVVLDTVDGPVRTISGQVEVEPIYYDPAYWDMLQTLIDGYGSLANALLVLNQFEQLVNVDLPVSLNFDLALAPQPEFTVVRDGSKWAIDQNDNIAEYPENKPSFEWESGEFKGLLANDKNPFLTPDNPPSLLYLPQEGQDPLSIVQVERNTPANTRDKYGNIVSVPNDTLRQYWDVDLRLWELIEGQRTNILTSPETLATQTVAVSSTTYALSFYGTGSVSLSGAYTGNLDGSFDYPDRAWISFTPTAGSLTLTVTGDVKYARLEVGNFPSSYGEGTRSADSVKTPTSAIPEWNPDEFSYVREYRLAEGKDSTYGQVLFSFEDGTLTEAIWAFRYVDSKIWVQGISGGSTLFSITTQAIYPSDQTLKIGISVKNGNHVFTIAQPGVDLGNGTGKAVIVGANTTASMPTGLVWKVDCDRYQGGRNGFCLAGAEALYPYAMSSGELLNATSYTNRVRVNNSEQISIPLEDWFNQTSSTFVVKGTSSPDDPDFTQTIKSLDDIISLQRDTSSNLIATISGSTINLGILNNSTEFSVSFSFGNGSISISRDGGNVSVGSYESIPSLSSMFILNSSSGDKPMGGNISLLAYYPSVIDDTQLVLSSGGSSLPENGWVFDFTTGSMKAKRV